MHPHMREILDCFCDVLYIVLMHQNLCSWQDLSMMLHDMSLIAIRRLYLLTAYHTCWSSPAGT